MSNALFHTKQTGNLNQGKFQVKTSVLNCWFLPFLPFRLSLNCGALGSQVFGTISVFCAISLLFWKIPGFWAIAAFWVRKSFYEVLDSLGVLINQQNCILPPFRNDNPFDSQKPRFSRIKNCLHQTNTKFAFQFRGVSTTIDFYSKNWFAKK